MATYDCNERQFIENLRKLIESKGRVVVNRIITHYHDERYGFSYLPDAEFRRYQQLVKREGRRTAVRAVKPFIEDRGNRFFAEGAVVHSGRPNRWGALSVPYVRTEYSFALWGETYRYTFDALYAPAVRLERRAIPGLGGKTPKGAGRGGSSTELIHVLRFQPPPEEALTINLPRSVLVFDAKRRVKTLP